jgi:diguanylate cyclase (GGDEF)-like protein
MKYLLKENEMLKRKIRILNKIGLAFTNSKDTDVLLQMILEESMNLTFSDGGSLYLAEKIDGVNVMVFKHCANSSIEFDFKGETISLDNDSVTGYVGLKGDTLVINDLEHLDEKYDFKLNKSFNHKINYKTKNMMIVPMKNEMGEVIGILQMLNKKKNPDIILASEKDFIENIRPYNEDDIEMISSLASQIAVLIDRLRLNAKLLRNVSQTRTTLISFFNGMKQAMATIGEDILEEQEMFKEYATFDKLTGLMTRREGLAFFEKQLEFARFNGVKVVACFIDINGLKYVNDTYGHMAGDELILAVSKIIKNNARGNDTIFRFGGDEFILVLFNIDKNTAPNIWRRIEYNFEDYNNKSNKVYKLSASHGFSEYDPVINQSIEELLKLADAEMYVNKKFMKEKMTPQ